VDDRVTREADDDLTDTEDGAMTDVQCFAEHIFDQRWQDVVDCALRVEN